MAGHAHYIAISCWNLSIGVSVGMMITSLAMLLIEAELAAKWLHGPIPGTIFGVTTIASTTVAFIFSEQFFPSDAFPVMQPTPQQAVATEKREAFWSALKDTSDVAITVGICIYSVLREPDTKGTKGGIFACLIASVLIMVGGLMGVNFVRTPGQGFNLLSKTASHFLVFLVTEKHWFTALVLSLPYYLIALFYNYKKWKASVQPITPRQFKYAMCLCSFLVGVGFTLTIIFGHYLWDHEAYWNGAKMKGGQT